MDSPDALSTPPDAHASPPPPEIEDDEDDDEEEDDDQGEVEVQDDDEDQDEEDAAAVRGVGSAMLIRASPNLDEVAGLREIGHEAVCWSLSSAKAGNGVEQIRDSSNDTYWQSDGSQPHYIQISFARRAAISHVAMYLDYNLDESYTPKKISVEVGMTSQDLQTAVFPSAVELQEPVGWCVIPLSRPLDPLDDAELDAPSTMTLRTYLVQIGILSMHQNGRDTHIRQVKLFGPRRNHVGGTTHQLEAVSADMFPRGLPEFSTVEVSQFSVIR